MRRLALLFALAAALNAAAPPTDTAVLAGGCYWGMQAVFERLTGVVNVTAGYAGAGKTRAEAVRIVYDPARVSYATLLQIFFAAAHDPTELNRQGPDIGPQYRSAIFYSTEMQRQTAEGYIARLTQAKVFPFPIVTQVTPLTAFTPESEDQQHYVDRHTGSDYVIENDLPRLEALERAFRPLLSR